MHGSCLAGVDSGEMWGGAEIAPHNTHAVQHTPNQPQTKRPDALARAGCPCRVAAIINDSVGVLAAARYEDEATEIGIILGTGTNACIVEKVGVLVRV
jgi:hypothetical protein